MAINNIEDLRNTILESLEGLRKGKIDIDQASITAKSGEAVMSSLKLQLQYNFMRNETPNIKFLQDSNKNAKLIEKQT